MFKVYPPAPLHQVPVCSEGIPLEDTIGPNLPWNEYFEWFGPRYCLEVVASNMEDMNIKDGSLEQVRYAFFLLF
ncbi:hypothetical protein IW261DRAFT_1519340 [Armillaria novae-zelandiae]|uniref:Uncharacterized protein n=1 Tax=Armillaria novae-zelandiae TaxID=153914 RepID=A0AA39NL90_9AGAR|nr:hypothetical protein IW261DRAFT_1519340 [Armillaria novae-zelandiae]